MAPVSANSGTIDPAAVPDATWSSLCGVLTTNLYRLPDRVAELRARCDRLGIPLIEDAATHPDRGRRPAHRWLGAAAAFGLFSGRATPTRRLNRPPGAPATDQAASRGPP